MESSKLKTTRHSSTTKHLGVGKDWLETKVPT